AEDGIRDRNVTGVQTCALPISSRSSVNLLLLSVSYIKTSLCPHSSHSPLTFNDSIIAFNSVSLKHSTQQIISHSHYLSVYSLIQDGALLLIFLLFQVLDMNLP